ncbi:hypothetical protein cyc_00826 [Cyclospora cayetanensis]|uniref:Transmembrane protein n=1 Tax=Cyclospora cayetanensis TaxID=88456 RepID=A0A1D3CT41_9EIME|nr:hypothetical protein cyc_00826 [Cyclospora cayetanensis]
MPATLLADCPLQTHYKAKKNMGLYSNTVRQLGDSGGGQRTTAPSSTSSLRIRVKPSESTDEDSVVFTDKQNEGTNTEDVPIKPHAFQAGADSATESEAGGSEADDAEETPSKESAGEGEDEAPEGRSEGEDTDLKESGKQKPPRPSLRAQQTAAKEAASDEQTAAEEAASDEQTAEEEAARPAAAVPSATEALQKKDRNAELPPVTAGASGKQELPDLEEEASDKETKTVIREHEEPKGPNRSLAREVLNERLKALGFPFVLGKEHFTVDFQHGFSLDASAFDASAAESAGVMHRAVSTEPLIKSEKSLFLAIDIDDQFLGTDVRLVQLTVIPEACSVQAEGACKTEWLLREPTPASPPHRILLLGFSSPTGSKFEFDDVLKQIQHKPMDLDLRSEPAFSAKAQRGTTLEPQTQRGRDKLRGGQSLGQEGAVSAGISLALFFSDHAKFFEDGNGKFSATPSWHGFALVSQVAGEEGLPIVDAPLVVLPPNATEAQKAEALRLSKEENQEIDGLTTPEHGGQSPGAGGRVEASTIFKYVLASLLLIGLFVGVTVSVCSCAKPSS